MPKTITHLKVPASVAERQQCLGPEGSAAEVSRVLQMLKGRWKLLILFNLMADPTLRTSQLLANLSGISQKVLTQQLRELADDGLIERLDFGERRPRVEYSLTDKGRELFPVLRSMRLYADKFPINQEQ